MGFTKKKKASTDALSEREARLKSQLAKIEAKRELNEAREKYKKAMGKE